MALIPSRDALIEPAVHLPVNPLEPAENYVLEYIYGYRMDDSSMNCRYSATGNVIYYAATVGVVLNPISNTQKFFGSTGKSCSSNAHTNTITCMNMSYDKQFVCTAQIGRYPSVFIWNSETRALKATSSIIRLGEQKYLPKSVTALAFSDNAEHIAIADANDEHRVYVYTTEGNKKIMMAPSLMGIIKAIAWNRKTGEKNFCTVGKKAVKFWFPMDSKKSPFVGKMPSLGLTTDFFCVAYDSNGNCFTGGANGLIYQWDSEGNSPNQIKAHQGVCYALHITNEGKMLSGGADGKILIHDLDGMKRETELKFRAPVISVDYAQNPTRILSALNDGTIIEVQVEQDNYYQIIMQGHHDGHLVALDSYEDNVITAGEDNKVIVWNYTDRTPFITSIINKTAEKGRTSGAQSKFPDNQRCRLLAINKVHGHIALALNNGVLQVREGPFTLDNIIFKTVVAEGKLITEMKYSHDGEKLAVACSDGHLYLYESDKPTDYQRLGVIIGKEGYITDMDWSTNGKCIRALCNNFMVYFIDPIKLRIVDGIF